MNTLKKLATTCLSVCFIISCAVFTSHAADGTIWFSDPQTRVGENVEIDFKVKGNGEAIGDTDIVLNYDPTMLEFISGGSDITNEGNGKLHFTGKGTGEEAELTATLVFRALQTGSPQVTVESSSGYLFSDEGLYFQEGFSTVSVSAAADGTTSVPGGQSAMLPGETVTVGDTTYSLAEDFIPVTIPQGFSETMVTYNGAERRFVANENGETLGYLKDASGAGAFFIYNAENATFSPYIVMGISENTSIALLDGSSEVSVPEGYQQAALTVSNYQLTAWQDMQHEGFYLIYAMNVYTGTKQLYSYDTAEGTYQRFIAPQATTNDAEVDTNKDDKNMMPFLLGGGAGILVMLIVIIVLAVKLLHRNQELDDIYDEYGITDEDAPPKEEKRDKNSSKKGKSGRVRSYDDEYEYDDDGYEDDAYDEYEDDEYVEYDDDFDDDYEDDGYDDFEDEYEEPPRVSSKGKKGSASGKGKKGYDLEFIDL